MAKTCTKTFIKRGQEIKKEALKSNGIYAVRYCLPAEVASLSNTTQEQWGIVMLKDGMVRISWNIDVHNMMSVGNLTQPWAENLTYFRSAEMEREFLTNYDMMVDEHIKHEKKLRELTMKLDNVQTHFDRLMAHPFHKIAERLRIFFS